MIGSAGDGCVVAIDEAAPLLTAFIVALPVRTLQSANALTGNHASVTLASAPVSGCLLHRVKSRFESGSAGK